MRAMQSVVVVAVLACLAISVSAQPTEPTAPSEPTEPSEPTVGPTAVATAAPAGSDDHVADPATPDRVTRPEAATRVRVGLTVLGVNRVSAPDEPFPSSDASVMLTTRWHDARLAFDASIEGEERQVFLGEEAAAKLATIWSPDLAIENEEGERVVVAQTLNVRADGNVTIEEIIDGRFRVPLDLRAFPFDTQQLRFVITPVAWNVRQVVLELIEDRTIVDDEVEMRDWALDAMRWEIHEERESRSGRPFSQLTIDLPAHPHPGFVVCTHHAELAGKKELAVRLDHLARWGFPLGFTLALFALYALYSSGIS